jgi:hypothetical protein
MVLLLTLSSIIVAIAPAGAVVVEGVEQGDLPLEWTLAAGATTSFDLVLPVDGTVTAANLTFEGAATEVPVTLEHGVDDWSAQDASAMENIDLSSGTLDITKEQMGKWVDSRGLTNYESASGVSVGNAVRLARTSPDFTGAGGGVWDYYKEVGGTRCLSRSSIAS